MGSVSRSNRSISFTIDHFFFFGKKGIVTRGRPFCSLVHPYKLIIGAFIKFTPIAFASSQDLEGIEYMNKTVLNAENPRCFMILLKVNCVFYRLNLFLSISQGDFSRGREEMKIQRRSSRMHWNDYFSSPSFEGCTQLQ